jgi:hypothetical protein
MTFCKGFAQEKPLPIIDMHLHALPATQNGPPPTAICAPPEEWPTHDPSKSWASAFMEILKNPNCNTPIWGGKTDKEVMDKTLKILQEHNIYGVTSGSLVDDYFDNSPNRILPALQFSFFNKGLNPEKVKSMLLSGKYMVFG